MIRTTRATAPSGAKTIARRTPQETVLATFSSDHPAFEFHIIRHVGETEDRVHIRAWYRQGKEWLPSRNGLFLSTHLLPELVAALRDAQEQIEQEEVLRYRAGNLDLPPVQVFTRADPAEILAADPFGDES